MCMKTGVINPENGQRIGVSSIMSDFGVLPTTDGDILFSSPEDVMTWRRACEINGRWWALLHFFDRKNFPKVK